MIKVRLELEAKSAASHHLRIGKQATLKTRLGKASQAMPASLQCSGSGDA